jgi:hypothetical protein
MTNQHSDQMQRPRHREDRKVQKLVQRIETKLALQAKGAPRSQPSKLEKPAMPKRNLKP